LQYKTSLGRLFRMKDAEYEYERLANSVFILGIVSRRCLAVFCDSVDRALELYGRHIVIG